MYAFLASVRQSSQWLTVPVKVISVEIKWLNLWFIKWLHECIILNAKNFEHCSWKIDSCTQFYSGKLIKGSVDYVEDVKQFITSAPDAKDVESLSKLVGAAAAAIETLNKIHISDQKAKSTKELKVMDIESKKALQQQDTETKLLLNREELMKQLIGDAQIIDADVTES